MPYFIRIFDVTNIHAITLFPRGIAYVSSWAGLLTLESSYSARPSHQKRQWPFWAFVIDYSGGTVRDFHPLPFLSS
jgi:hypothetical protein